MAAVGSHQQSLGTFPEVQSAPRVSPGSEDDCQLQRLTLSLESAGMTEPQVVMWAGLNTGRVMMK